MSGVSETAVPVDGRVLLHAALGCSIASTSGLLQSGHRKRGRNYPTPSSVSGRFVSAARSVGLAHRTASARTSTRAAARAGTAAASRTHAGAACATCAGCRTRTRTASLVDGAASGRSCARTGLLGSTHLRRSRSCERHRQTSGEHNGFEHGVSLHGFRCNGLSNVRAAGRFELQSAVPPTVEGHSSNRGRGQGSPVPCHAEQADRRGPCRSQRTRPGWARHFASVRPSNPSKHWPWALSR